MQVKIPKQYQNLATVELVLKGVLLHALASAVNGEVDDRNLGLCHTDESRMGTWLPPPG